MHIIILNRLYIVIITHKTVLLNEKKNNKGHSINSNRTRQRQTRNSGKTTSEDMTTNGVYKGKKIHNNIIYFLKGTNVS